MKTLKLTGGARIGVINASMPLASLTVSKEKLELNVSIIGNFVFQSSDIISIEPYGVIPFIGQGIKINHQVATYKKKIIFWTFKNPKSVIKLIKETGFLNKENLLNPSIDRTIIDQQAKSGSPFKKIFTIGAIIIWNLLFLADVIPFVLNKSEGLPIGNGVLSAIGLLFITSLVSLLSPFFRKLILKEGRDIEDIKKLAYFVLFISGLLFLFFMNNQS